MSRAPERRDARRLMVPGILTGTIFASLLLLGLTGWFLWHSSQRAIVSAHSVTENLVSALDRHAARMIDSVQIVMTTAAQQLGPDSRDPARRSFLDAWLADVARNLVHLHSVSLLDTVTGEIVYDFVRAREASPALDAEILHSVSGGVEEPFRVGRAVFDTVSNAWLLPLSRRVPPRQGRNDSVVVVTLSLDYLQAVYASLDIGAAGTVVLFRSDGEILARRPYDVATVGQNVGSGATLFREHLLRSPSGTYRTLSAIDGVDRIISFRRLDATPLVAVVSLSVAEVMARWRQDLSADLAIAGCCAVLLVGLGLTLMRFARQRDRIDIQLQTTLQHMEQGLLMVGPDQRTEVYNRRVLELLDLPEDLLARRPLPHEIFDFQALHGEFRKTPPEMRDKIVQGVLNETPSRYERVRPNGTVLEIRTNPLPDGGAVRTYTDVTERHKAIEEINASMAFANSLVNSSPDCIQLLDLEGRVTFISDLGQELFEIADFETVRGRPFRDFFPEADRDRVDLALRRVGSGQTDRFSRMCPTLAGIPKWWEFIITPVHEIGRGPERLFVVARDISARQAHAEELGRAKEAAERASLAKTQFLASMSHEIRTPLNAILGFAALARERQHGDRELSRQIGLIEKAGEALLTIINDVLDLSKIEAGKIELEERPLVLQNVVEDCLSLTRGLAQQKGLTLCSIVSPDMPGRIVADEARLRQILLNLLNNAMKFTPAGSVELSVERSPAAGRMTISVRDTGIGIAQDRIPHLFQDFVQVDGSISRHYGGTGLGLSISRRLIALMGGEIGVSSVVGQGSTFHVELPLVEAAPEPVSTESSGPMRQSAGQPRSILLVDDVSINLEIVGEMLASAGHDVDFASSGPAAIAVYRDNRHELILMDVQMPDMDGLETTRRIRDLDAAGLGVPIIALTANVFSQQIALCREAGMDDHLGKPFHRDALLAMVERWTGAGARAPRLEGLADEPDAVAPVLDMDRQDELQQLIGPDKVLELSMRLRDDLRERLRSADLEALRADAHNMVSAAGLLGFAELSAAARQLERAIETEDDIAMPLTGLLAARTRALNAISAVSARCAQKTDDPTPQRVI